ncbi:S53 family peptidase [Azospirillum picis]|uniref:Kumamolisin n=1 Tax=Azospirillum picis TaxID=488438 RepID=A0ABU0MUN2_9PROT|nr:S53 family peptidase [Azospirillum picis]MBP2303367.1 kumamolisin [Azospirillum picis]MDQ0537208.1 kumamolisin [Azospirillum picis]
MESRYALSGSEQPRAQDAARVGAPAADEVVHVTVYVRQPAPLRSLLSGLAETPPSGRLARRDFLARFAADPQDLDKVAAFARTHGLQVDGVDAGKCLVRLSGPASAVGEAFGVELALFAKGRLRYRSHVGAVRLPEDLKDIVTLVAGLDNHPIARRLATVSPSDAGAPQPGSIAQYTAPELAALYRFPDGDGEGRCLGIIELAAGYLETDLDAYFAALAIPKPEIVAVGPNDPGSVEAPSHGYGEVVMDIEVAAAVVPKARTVVYFATENSQKGFMEVLHEAIHDAANAPEAISVSWGEPESEWSRAAADQMRRIIAEAALLGVTICVAAGDEGASDGTGDGHLAVDFPGSVPEALCCGGTRLVARNGRIEQEITWNDPWWKLATGGGVSTLFPMPSYQAQAGIRPVPAPPAAVQPTGTAGRAVPDVAANADPMTGYRLYILGDWHVSGGTSAVAPLWAALAIRLNQALGGPVGFLNPILYGLPKPSAAAAFNDITEGDNGFYQAQPGWDACTGLGSPDGAGLLTAMAGKMAAKGA